MGKHDYTSINQRKINMFLPFAFIDSCVCFRRQNITMQKLHGVYRKFRINNSIYRDWLRDLDSGFIGIFDSFKRKNVVLILCRAVISVCFVLFCFFVSGCASSGSNNSMAVLPQGVSEQPAIQPRYTMIPPSEGSLWTEESHTLFEDTKARNTGDTVVVDIVENSSSKMDVNTQTGRATKMDVGVPNFFGFMQHFGTSSSKPASTGLLADKMVGAKYTNTFKGQAKNDRSGSITASIAARIIDVLPNGNLSIFGRRAMKVNGEVQYIVVSGIVRPEDISPDNRIKSTYLADSKIEYYGRGTLADKQKPGWGTRLFDNLWPF